MVQFFIYIYLHTFHNNEKVITTTCCSDKVQIQAYIASWYWRFPHISNSPSANPIRRYVLSALGCSLFYEFSRVSGCQCIFCYIGRGNIPCLCYSRPLMHLRTRSVVTVLSLPTSEDADSSQLCNIVHEEIVYINFRVAVVQNFSLS